MLFMLVLVISACSKTSVDEHMINAEKAVSEKLYNKAIIELKNILQQKPDDKKARILIGQIYLQVGDGASAEKEFNRYIEYGGNEVSVLEQKAQAWYLQHHYEKLITYLNNKAEKNLASQVIMGKAKLRLGKLSEASDIFNQVLAAEPSSVDAKLGIAEVGMFERKYSDALRKIDEVLGISRNNINAFYLKGRIKLLQGKSSEAISPMTKAVKLLNGVIYGEEQLNVQVLLIQALIQNREHQLALPYIETLSKYYPKISITYYYKGLFAYLEKDYEQAEVKLNEVIKATADHMPSLLLLGAVHFIKGNFEQANNYLTKFVNNAPNHLQARKLLATVRVKLNRHAEALDVLTTLDASKRDEELTRMIGQLAVEAGHEALAINILKQASTKSTDQTIRKTLAAAYLKRGQYDNAIQELNSLSDKNEQQQLMLIDAYLKGNKIEKAKELLEEINKQRPDSEITKVVAGIVALHAGERIKARNLFQQALEIKPEFIHPKIYLASMFYADGNLDEARRLYDIVLVDDDDNVPAYLGLAQIAEKKGNFNQALDLLKEINTKSKVSLYPAVVLGGYYIRRQNNELAKGVLLPAQQANPSNVQINLLLSHVYRKLNKSNQAVLLLNPLLKSYSKNILIYIELAGALKDSGKSLEAKGYLNQALSISPKSIRVKHALGLLEMSLGNTSLAQKIARELKINTKSAFAGYTLSGDIYVKNKQFIKAYKSYRLALKTSPNSYTLLKLYSAYHQSGEKQKAFMLIKDWVKKYPKDLLVGLDLANILAESGKQADAIKQYKKMLAVNSRHLPSLNNLAMLYVDDNTNEAVRYAKEAYELASSYPAIQDTLGWAYIKNGQIQTGLALLKQAATQTDDRNVHYHLAFALHKNGQSTEARNILLKVLMDKSTFLEAKNAMQLLNQIDKL